eukprot:1143533-Pelagomonas_calceolata.AAC.11
MATSTTASKTCLLVCLLNTTDPRGSQGAHVLQASAQAHAGVVHKTGLEGGGSELLKLGIGRELAGTSRDTASVKEKVSGITEGNSGTFLSGEHARKGMLKGICFKDRQKPIEESGCKDRNKARQADRRVKGMVETISNQSLERERSFHTMPDLCKSKFMMAAVALMIGKADTG